MWCGTVNGNENYTEENNNYRAKRLCKENLFKLEKENNKQRENETK